MNELHIGDAVRDGLRLATVTDFGTVLVAIATAAGVSRMACPWELVGLGAAHRERDLGSL
jgi:hypothetical protein